MTWRGGGECSGNLDENFRSSRWGHGLWTIPKPTRTTMSITRERINKVWSIHKIEYYLALKRSEALTHVTTWMNLKNITLSEVIQTQKDKYCMIPLV